MNPVDENNLLLHCPRCKYSLQGLPVEHACPECGLLFNRRWRVFGGRSMPPPSFAEKPANIIVPIMSLAMGGASLVIGPGQGLPLPFCIFFAAACLFAFYMLVLLRVRKFIALSDAELIVYYNPQRIARLEWGAIDGASHNALWHELVIRNVGDPIKLSEFKYFGVRTEELNACIAEINQLAQAARKESGDAAV